MKNKLYWFSALGFAAATVFAMFNAQPTSVRAQDNGKGNLSTPISAAKTFFTAMKAGDTNLFRRITIGTDYQKDWMVAYIRSAIATDQLVKAATARFGHDEADKAFGEMQRSSTMAAVGLAALTNAEAKVDGTNAAVTFKSGAEGTPDPLTLQQSGGQWKVVLGEDINRADFNKDAMEAMAGSQEQCAQNISAGKYKTGAEASQAMMAAMMAKIQSQHPSR